MNNQLILPHKWCYEAIESVVATKGLTDYDLLVSPGTSKGDNFMGDIWRVTVKEKNSDQVLTLIMKTSQTHREVSEDLLEISTLACDRETYAYNEVFPALSVLQESASVMQKIKFEFVRCHYTSQESRKELFVFEDLKTQGFESLGGSNQLGIEHVRLVVASLAKLHALSFVLQKRLPEEFSRITKKCPDFTADLKCYRRFIRDSLDLAAEVIESPLLKEKIIEVRKTYEEVLKEALRGRRYSVIRHGDCSVRNVMFRNEDEKPVELRLIDYQLLRYGAPAADLMYLMFTSTDGQLRRAHHATCLQLYHETLTDVLRAYSLDARDVFPRQAFDEQVRELGRYGFLSGVSVCKLFLLDGDETMDTDDMMSRGIFKTPPKGAALDRYLKNLTEVVTDCVEFGYL